MGPPVLVVVSPVLVVGLSPSAARAARAVEPLAGPPANRWKEQGPGRDDQGEGLAEEAECVPTKEASQQRWMREQEMRKPTEEGEREKTREE